MNVHTRRHDEQAHTDTNILQRDDTNLNAIKTT